MMSDSPSPFFWMCTSEFLYKTPKVEGRKDKRLYRWEGVVRAWERRKNVLLTVARGLYCCWRWGSGRAFLRYLRGVECGLGELRTLLPPWDMVSIRRVGPTEQPIRTWWPHYVSNPRHKGKPSSRLASLYSFFTTLSTFKFFLIQFDLQNLEIKASLSVRT